MQGAIDEARGVSLTPRTGSEAPSPSIPIEIDRISIPFLRIQERKWLLAGVDGAITWLGMWLAYMGWRTANPASLDFRYVPWEWVIGATLTWLLISWLAGAYDLTTADRVASSLKLIPTIALVVWGGALLGEFVFLKTYPRPALVVAALLVPLAVSAWRATYAKYLSRPGSPTRVIIVGPESLYTDLAAAAARQGQHYAVLGYVGPGNDDTPGWLGHVTDLPALVGTVRPHQVAVAPRLSLPNELVEALSRAVEQGVEVVDFSASYEAIAEKVAVEHVGEFWLTALPTRPRTSSIQELLIRLVDVVGALVGLVLTLAAGPLVCAAIALETGRPLFYCQERLGLGGRRFTICKFRSMRIDAEAGDAVWALRHDCRVTRVGHFLRATHLDELPQFWNVLRGDMSLVGPRPERPEFTDKLSEALPFYRLRLSVRPGLTGMKQIKFGYASSPEEHLEVLRHDLYYIKHRSLALNMVIMARTVGSVIGMEGR
jgi:exopolysaccharide biosynthesis polyprenyl glycosylphosphotransferase